MKYDSSLLKNNNHKHALSYAYISKKSIEKNFDFMIPHYLHHQKVFYSEKFQSYTMWKKIWLLLKHFAACLHYRSENLIYTEWKLLLCVIVRNESKFNL